jgi:tripartite-type tricarboxylate transporter receptor subunit TctC
MRITMMHVRRRFLHVAAAAIAGLAAPSIASAQNYPARPVRMIVPFAPGGPTDVSARLIAQKLSENLGRQFFIENIGGASGNIATGQAAKAAPDGYTILIAVNSHVINPTLFARVPYDARKDFEPVTLAVSFASALVVHPSLPATSVKELVALIKANPAKYAYASPGLGTPSHLLGEQLKVSLGLDLVHVPFAGSGPTIASVVAGHTPIGIGALASVAPQVNGGKLRALAAMSKTRSPSLPELPTIAEAGYPDMDGDGWVGALVPAGTPKEIVALLHREIVKALALPEMKDRLAAVGLDPIGSTPDEFAMQLRDEAEKWAMVIRAAGLKAE